MRLLRYSLFRLNPSTLKDNIFRVSHKELSWRSTTFCAGDGDVQGKLGPPLLLVLPSSSNSMLISVCLFRLGSDSSFLPQRLQQTIESSVWAEALQVSGADEFLQEVLLLMLIQGGEGLITELSLLINRFRET